jgi:hypothetical protein
MHPELPHVFGEKASRPKRCKRVFRAEVRNIAGRKLSKVSSACAQGSAGTGSTSTGLGASTGPSLAICPAFSSSNAFGIDFKGQRRTEPPKRSGRLQLLLH